jgi:hypothetical protein
LRQKLKEKTEWLHHPPTHLGFRKKRTFTEFILFRFELQWEGEDVSTQKASTSAGKTHFVACVSSEKATLESCRGSYTTQNGP